MAQPDEQATRAFHQQRIMATVSEKGQKSDSTEQSITKLISHSSEPHRETGGEIDVLAYIANDFKLDNKKGPPVNQHLACEQALLFGRVKRLLSSRGLIWRMSC